jgi:hypothetical protein
MREPRHREVQWLDKVAQFVSRPRYGWIQNTECHWDPLLCRFDFTTSSHPPRSVPALLRFPGQWREKRSRAVGKCHEQSDLQEKEDVTSVFKVWHVTFSSMEGEHIRLFLVMSSCLLGTCPWTLLLSPVNLDGPQHSSNWGLRPSAPVGHTPNSHPWNDTQNIQVREYKDCISSYVPITKGAWENVWDQSATRCTYHLRKKGQNVAR